MPLPYTTTIIAESAARDLTLLKTVKAELGITNGEQDANLARLIQCMSSVVEELCGRIFARGTVKDSFRVDSYRAAELPLLVTRKPLQSITTLVENGVTLAAADYEFDPGSGQIWRMNGVLRSWWACAKIEATYVGGFTLLTELPWNIERAVILLVKAGYFKLKRDPNIRAESVPGVWDVTYWVGELTSGVDPDQVVNLLAPFKEVRI